MSYGGDVDRGLFLDVLNWVLTSIALMVVVLRIVSRAVLEKARLGLDDAFIVLAMAVNLARAIYISVCKSQGFGQHLQVLLEADPIATTKLLRLLVILQAIGLWTFTTPKLPVAALLIRLFETTTKRLRYVLYSSVGVLLAWASVVTITTFVQCTPRTAQWNPMVKGTCWDLNVNLNLGYVLGAYSATLDFAFALYPCLKVSKLQMKRSKKWLIAASLSLGFIACITTCYKLSMIREIANTADPTWATIPLEVWNSVEGAALIIAASVSLTRPLIILIGQKFSQISSQLTKSTDFIRGSSRESRKPSKGSSGTKPGAFPQEQSLQSDDDILLRDIRAVPSDAESGRQGSQQTQLAGIHKTGEVSVNGSRPGDVAIPPSSFY